MVVNYVRRLFYFLGVSHLRPSQKSLLWNGREITMPAHTHLKP